MLAGSLLVAACAAGSGSPPTGSSTSGVASPPAGSEWPEPSPPTGDGVTELVRSALPETSFSSGIAWKDHTFVIAGAAGCWEGRCRPTVWTSVDARTWAEADTPDCNGAGELVAVSATASGFVAVGSCDGPGGRQSLLVLVSGDGRRWARAIVEDAELSDQGDGWVERSVVAGPNGLMILAGGNGQARSWRSLDGREWRVVLGLPRPPRALVAASDVGFLFAELTGDDGGVGRFSDDGSRWVEADLPEGDLWSVVGLAGGFMATAEQGRTWASSDGLTWRELGRRSDTASRLVPATRGILAVGSDASVHAWWSAAGETWLPLAQVTVDEQGIQVIGALVADGRLVVVLERQTSNPDPDVQAVMPSETIVWSVPFAG